MTCFTTNSDQWKIFAVVILGMAGISLSGQNPSYYLQKYKGDFTVRLKDETTTTVLVKKGKLDITENHVQENLFLDKRIAGMGDISLTYEPPFSAIEDIKAYSMVPKTDKDAYRKMKVQDVEDKEVLSDHVFYGGERAKFFAYPSLKKGAISHLEYTKNIYEPRLLGSETFQSYYDIINQSVTLEYDKDVDITIDYYNSTEDDYIHTVTDKGHTVIESWMPKKYTKLVSESQSPGYLYMVPHIVFRINSYKADGKTIPVLRNTADLYKWYSGLVDDVNRNTSPALEKLTDSLTANAKTDREKAEKIFSWVQKNVKYIAFEDGMEGFRPRLPSDVFEKRYGDCKDMSCLVVNMLQHANIPAYHTWIGTRDLPYSYEKVPSPLADNHMIACAKIDGKLMFLDATDPDLPFSLPSFYIQGKEALVGFTPDSFAIEKVPVLDSRQSINNDSVTFSLQNLKLVGNGERNYTGYYADQINSSLNNNDKKELNNMLKYHVRKGNNKCNSSDYEVNRNSDYTNVDYHFEVPDYAYRNDSDIILNMNLEKIMTDYNTEPDRVHPVEYRYTHLIKRKFVLNIPDGYRVKYKPENTSFKKDNYGFDISYHQYGNQLIYVLEINMNTLLLKPEEFDQWNEMIKKLNQSYSETIILEKA